jgi:flavin reductase (DIM6/NTAB) family NADH-FMN oxidoreductase RutF
LVIGVTTNKENKMEKIMVGKISVSPGRPVIAGAMVNGKANYITLGSFGGMSNKPPIVYISINKEHYTNAGIKENGYFSVNIPSKNVVRKMDYVGLVSGRDVDKSGVFIAFFGSVKKAPMISECPANMLCKVIDVVDLPNNEVFIGEVVETYVNQDCLTDGKPDTRKLNPVFMAGGKYCTVGEACGVAYEEGKTMFQER